VRVCSVAEGSLCNLVGMVDVDAHSKVEMFISLRNVPQMDMLSKSDPLVVVYLRDPVSGEFRLLDRTETIWNSHSPDFKKRIVMDYFFEVNQELQFKVFDADSTSKDLNDHDFIGEVTLSLAEIVSSPFGKLKINIHNAGKPVRGATGLTELVLRVEELSENKDLVNFAIRGVGLQYTFNIFTPAPFIEFFRVREDNTWVSIFVSNPASGNDPKFSDFSLSIQKLCNGDMGRPLKLIVWYYNFWGNKCRVGEAETSLTVLTSGPGKVGLIHPRRGLRGHLQISTVITPVHSFLDYIKAGCQINLMVAIDYTASNGDPSESTSLHYQRGDRLNQYETAIRAVGDILASYDTDKQFPVWGFVRFLVFTTLRC